MLSRLNSQFPYFPGWVGGWWVVVVGGWGEIKIKAKLSPAKAGAWAELGKNAIYSGHLRLFQQPRAAHALRSDQNKIIN